MDLEQYYDDIYRYCYLRLNDRHAAEDMAQETFLRFLEASEYRDMGKVPPDKKTSWGKRETV